MDRRVLDLLTVLVCIGIVSTYGLMVYTFNSQVDECTSYIDYLSKRLNTTLEELHTANNTIINLQNELKKARENYTNLSVVNNNLMKEINRSRVRIPTLEEVRMFLWRDRTNYHTYLVGKYECVNFATDLARNASKHGLPVAVCYMRFPRSGHAIVAFNTTIGVVYFDPILDKRVNISVGEDYYRINGLSSTYSGKILYCDCIWINGGGR